MMVHLIQNMSTNVFRGSPHSLIKRTHSVLHRSNLRRPVLVPAAERIKANGSNRRGFKSSCLYSIGLTLHIPPLTDYICSRVKGGPSTRIYLCKRLPNYQSWFSTSLNFLIGLPFWLPLITRFHIPLMIGGRVGTFMCTRSHILTVYIQIGRHTGSYWHLRTNEHEHTSHSPPLITLYGCLCVCVCVTCNNSVFTKRHIKPFFFFPTTRSFIKQFVVSLLLIDVVSPLLQHPYPSEEQKKQLAQDTGLTILQVNNW